ncbi:DUF2493 domain-containing protein [Nonomuraea turkmeniaca]|uniref:DUF2493 domain-containing protein n=1 Tax=Nonomuraea turkmeniaca TaxID=103838 RepID=A0A5S4F9R9_9ACTN|nr:DUF2493 domain-containing protein [Nonomuraea turkmeniaca]TMR13792.1 DUF2493 domain-containing protein [Nonomuraea turkmeniaca]
MTPPAAGGRPWEVLFTGARDCVDKALLWRVLDEIHAEHPDMLVKHGACYPAEDEHGRRSEESADWLAHLWCLARGVPDREFPANWGRYGDAAGPIRNNAMIASGADECVAFPHPWSRGTFGCARRAERAGIPTRRFTPTPPLRRRTWSAYARR